MIHVVMCSDSAFSPWAATTLRSIADRHDEGSVAVHLLCDEGLARADRDRLRAVAADHVLLEFRPAEGDRVHELPALPNGGRIVWWRLTLAETFPDLDRAIFIDADTLVIDPLDELWQTPLSHPLAAVANVVEPSLHAAVRSIGADPNTYFNAGVFLIDLARFREEGLPDRLLEMARREHEHLHWADQDVLNVVLKDRWQRLHPRWNTMNSFWTWAAWAEGVHGGQRLDEARRSPGILHFEGPAMCKPWHTLSDHPWRKQYLATLARTPWADDAPIQGRDLVTQIIRGLPRRAHIPAYWWVRRMRERVRRSRPQASEASPARASERQRAVWNAIKTHQASADAILASGDAAGIKRLYIDLGADMESAAEGDPDVLPVLSFPENAPVVAGLASDIHGKILDIGCGPDPVVSTRLARDPSRSVVAMDIGLGTVRLAVTKARALGVQMVGVVGDAEALPFRASTFDGCVSEDTIEHLPDDRAGALEMARVLRAGGRAIIATPNRHRLEVVVAKVRDRRRGIRRSDETYFASNSHLREYDWRQLEDVARGPFVVRRRASVGWTGGWKARVATRLVGHWPFRWLSRMIVLDLEKR